ncbi:MAG: PIN domain-containing protein [Bifidobacterium sp.]|nr:PIN domain-containing protein [Bifidobacterium sp.]
MTADTDGENGPRYPERAVVDTCVLLDIALGATDGQANERLPRSNGLVDDALAGKLELLLPAPALIELSTDHVLRAGINPVEREFRRKKQLVMQWCKNSELMMVDLTGKAAEWFNENRCVQNIRPGDAAILSAAKYCHADAIYTWDTEFMRKVNAANDSGGIGIVALEPPERPIVLPLGLD